MLHLRLPQKNVLARNASVAMDFGDFIWIIPIVYLLRRLLFRSRRPGNIQKPTARPPLPARSRPDRDELQDAMGEIGRALGLPEDMWEEDRKKTARPPAPAPIPFAQADPAQNPVRLAAAEEEAISYDAREEPIYETEAWFADEEAFEAGENAPFPDPGADNLKKEGNDFDDLKNKGEPLEARSPYERAGASRHALSRLATTASLREAVVMKELFDRPVALRGKPRPPLRKL